MNDLAVKDVILGSEGAAPVLSADRQASLAAIREEAQDMSPVTGEELHMINHFFILG